MYGAVHVPSPFEKYQYEPVAVVMMTSVLPSPLKSPGTNVAAPSGRSGRRYLSVHVPGPVEKYQSEPVELVTIMSVLPSPLKSPVVYVSFVVGPSIIGCPGGTSSEKA